MAQIDNDGRTELQSRVRNPLNHLYDGIVKGGASAVLAASIFHYGTYSVNEAKQYLASKDIPVRI